MFVLLPVCSVPALLGGGLAHGPADSRSSSTADYPVITVNRAARINSKHQTQEKRLAGRQLVRDVVAKSADLTALVAVAEAADEDTTLHKTLSFRRKTMPIFLWQVVRDWLRRSCEISRTVGSCCALP